jgi:hypothetical protein
VKKKKSCVLCFLYLLFEHACHVSDIDTEELGFDFGVERVLREKKRSRFRHIRRTEVKAQSIYYACVFKYIYT